MEPQIDRAKAAALAHEQRLAQEGQKPEGEDWVVTEVFFIAAVLLALTSFGFFFAAIWTVGPNSGRLGGTGALVLVLAAVAIIGCDVSSENADRKRRRQ